MRRVVVSLVVLLLAGSSCRAELPAVTDVSWPHLRDHCRELLRGLDAAKAPLPAETARALQALLDREPADPDDAVAAVQKLLDPHCLVGVNINPESRVKAARGTMPAELRLGQGTVVLVRVHNDGGVTSSLAVGGPGVAAAKEDGGWLEAVPVTRARLSGRRLEYVALRLTPREAGKREATLRFDVGQGTQDLGFRAEVPVLFTVRTP
jgi:hypothetical protein